MKLRLRPATPPRRMAHPTVPTPTRAPLAARAASGALTLLAVYAGLTVLTYLDLLTRLLGPLLGGGSLPIWAFAGFIAAAVGIALGTLLTRIFYRDAQRMRDQDRRAAVRFVLPFMLVIVIHATLVAGPLSRWAQAAPLIGAPLVGVFAVALVPLMVLAAVVALLGRRQADAWLNALPD